MVFEKFENEHNRTFFITGGRIMQLLLEGKNHKEISDQLNLPLEVVKEVIQETIYQ